MAKKISAAAFIHDDVCFLACHATLNPPPFNLPKGGIEANETPWEACLRELEEETGLIFSPATPHTDLGTCAYTKTKDLHLFDVPYQMDTIDISKLICRSLTKAGFPENDAFIKLRFDDHYLKSKLTESIYNTLHNKGLI